MASRPTLPPVALSPVVTIAGLVKRYAGRAVVDDLTMSAGAGEVTAVLGSNGAGKTTTIECCEGLRTPDAGTVRVLGLDPRADAPELRARVGVMLQDGGLPMGARAGEVLGHIATLHADPLPLGDLVERLGIGAFAHTAVRQLSGGQRQRLALACALVGRPELVFLDEPSAGMDPQSRHAVWDLVRELRVTGTGVVLTTHLMDEAAELSDHVWVLDRGTVIADGTVDELLTGDASLITVRATPGLDTSALLSTLGGSWSAEATPDGYRLSGPIEANTQILVAEWLATAGTIATSITVGRRTLEDVFLDLTGRSLR